MAPTRAMTGDTVVNDIEKGPQSPTDTEATFGGDAIIEIGDNDGGSTRRSSSSTSRSESDSSAQPQTDNKPPTFLRRVTNSFKSPPEPLGVTEINTRKLENTPNGFPRLAAFQSSEANFSLYRSFSYLHSRVLLDLQDELTTLEKELDDLDWDDCEASPDRLRSRDIDIVHASREGQDVRNRRVVLREVKDKLMEYDKVLIKARTLETFQRPGERNYRSVRRFYNNEKPLMDAEMDSIRAKEDTVSLRSGGREWGGFDGSIETGIFRFDQWLKRVFGLKKPPLQRLFRTPELHAKTSSDHIAYYSSTRIDALINILITLVIFILLVVPVIAMYLLTSTPNHTVAFLSNGTDSSTSSNGSEATSFTTHDTLNAVGVLMVFTLLFSAAMSMLTKAARHELFAASAAYCAILVVFIGNFTGPGN